MKHESKNLSVSQHSATFRIENVVIATNLEQNIDLQLIAERYKDADFNLNKFPGICFHNSTPKCAILLFNNGKAVITGLKNSKDAPVILKKVISKLNAIGIEVKIEPELNIVNLVVALNYQHKINLDKASLILPNSVYEPEVFPGLIYRIIQPFRSVYLIFSSGKVVLTGLKNEADIITAIKNLGTKLKESGLLD